jgi:hypothetical protein
MNVKQPDRTRGNIAFVIIILLGYGLGLLIKHVNIGLILGLAIGLFATGILGKR